MIRWFLTWLFGAPARPAADLAVPPGEEKARLLREMHDASAKARALAAINRDTPRPSESALLRARRAAVRPNNPRHN